MCSDPCHINLGAVTVCKVGLTHWQKSEIFQTSLPNTNPLFSRIYYREQDLLCGTFSRK